MRLIELIMKMFFDSRDFIQFREIVEGTANIHHNNAPGFWCREAKPGGADPGRGGGIFRRGEKSKWTGV
jgi:hypothetical protein